VSEAWFSEIHPAHISAYEQGKREPPLINDKLTLPN